VPPTYVVQPIAPVIVPQHPQYPSSLPNMTFTSPLPSAPVSVDPLNDAFLALKLQEEEDNKKTRQAKDEDIAKAFAAEEQKRRQEAADREKADTYLAQRIAAEEQQQEAKRMEEARAREAARKREEEERKRLEAEKKNKIAADEALAKKIAEEEQKALQLRKDFELAKKLDDQDKKATPPPSPGFVYPSIYGSSSIPFNSSAYPTFNRDHVIAIHNRYCFCGNTQPYNNNHLHAVHTTHCNCGYSLHAVQNPNSNHGRKHVHDYRCCGINHMHTDNCYCAYRSHKHNHLCCSLNHKHDDYCHCCAK